MAQRLALPLSLSELRPLIHLGFSLRSVERLLILIQRHKCVFKCVHALGLSALRVKDRKISDSRQPTLPTKTLKEGAGGGCGDGEVVKVLATPAWKPEFRSPEPRF